MGEDRYLVGSTYEWTDKTNDPTQEAKTELLEKLERLIDCEFEVVDQRAGIRPTVVDRRPLVGQHPNHKSMYVLNGLGTRGVLVAPSMAEALYNSIEKNTSLSRRNRHQSLCLVIFFCQFSIITHKKIDPNISRKSHNNGHKPDEGTTMAINEVTNELSKRMNVIKKADHRKSNSNAVTDIHRAIKKRRFNFVFRLAMPTPFVHF